MHREDAPLAQGNTAMKRRLASKPLDGAWRSRRLAAWDGFLSALLLLGELGAEGQRSVASGT